MTPVALSWCASLGLYLLFAGQISGSELGSGLALATLATAWSIVVGRCGKSSFGGWQTHVRPVLKGFGHLVPATLRTAGILVRVAVRGGSPGRTTCFPFVHGDGSNPADRARRATALLVASLAPDSFVVRAAPERGDVLLHVLIGPAPAPDPRWLI